MVKDSDIRPILLEHIKIRNASDPDALIIEEFGLCQGNARIDVALVNGSLNGYEIKSESDTLERLSRQQEIYNRIFDSITLVLSKRHFKKAVEVVPHWWGLSKVLIHGGELKIFEERPSGVNDSPDPPSIAQLLWRDEALAALKERGLHKGIMSKPRDILWGRLVEFLSIKELKLEVRRRLKLRQNWRSG